jgi:hypothetical protein
MNIFKKLSLIAVIGAASQNALAMKEEFSPGKYETPSKIAPIIAALERLELVSGEWTPPTADSTGNAASPVTPLQHLEFKNALAFQNSQLQSSNSLPSMSSALTPTPSSLPAIYTQQQQDVSPIAPHQSLHAQAVTTSTNNDQSARKVLYVQTQPQPAAIQKALDEMKQEINEEEDKAWSNDQDFGKVLTRLETQMKRMGIKSTRMSEDSDSDKE